MYEAPLLGPLRSYRAKSKRRLRRRTPIRSPALLRWHLRRSIEHRESEVKGQAKA